jgi:LysM repeat protein
MKLQLFSKMTAKPRGRKVVRASAARAMRGSEDDYYEAEPNMKLSHAFMVVLILHVVAVGGIYAFNQIKVQKKSDLLANISNKITQATGGTTVAAAAPVAKTVVAAPPVQRMPGDADEPLPAVVSDAPAVKQVAAASASIVPPPVVASETVASAAAKPAPVKVDAKPASAPGIKPAAQTVGAATYKVEKGDNPYTIAKKLSVSYQDLLKVNGIDDPTKLQIGQVLKVPR